MAYGDQLEWYFTLGTLNLIFGRVLNEGVLEENHLPELPLGRKF